MAAKLDLQKEIIAELREYSSKIINGTETIVSELRSGRMDDTDEVLNLVIQGINWVIEVFNNCEDIINRDKEYVVKSRMAQAVTRLGSVLKERDDIKIAACLEVDFMPFLRSMAEASDNIEVIYDHIEE